MLGFFFPPRNRREQTNDACLVLRMPEVLRIKARHADLLKAEVSLGAKEATRNKCIASSNKCLTSSNKKLVETRKPRFLSVPLSVL